MNLRGVEACRTLIEGEKLRHGRSTPERKTPPHNHYSKNKNPNLRTELAAVLKLNQVDL